MKKIYVWGLALFAVLLFSSIAVASAMAESPVWLKNGEAVTAALAVETTGEVSLTDLKTALGAATVLCMGAFDGTVNTLGKDEITKVLNLAKQEIVELALAIEDCTNVANCPSPLVWAQKLFWDTQLELVGTEFKDVTLAGAWEIDCTEPLIGLLEDLCEGNATADLKNAVGGVEGVFLAADNTNTALCTLSGEMSGDIETATGDAAGLSVLTGGGTLSVSEV